MQKPQKRFLSIQIKFFTLFACAVTFSSLLVGISAYIISSSALKREITNSYSTSMQYVADSVAGQIHTIQSFSDYFYTDVSVKKLLMEADTSSYDYVQAKEDIERFVAQLFIKENLPNYLLVQVEGRNGVRLSWSPGVTQHLFQPDGIEDEVQRMYLESSDKRHWQFHLGAGQSELLNDPASDTRFLALMRLIPDDTYREVVGCMTIFVHTRIFDNIDAAYNIDHQGTVYLFDGARAHVNGAGPLPELVQEVLLDSGSGPMLRETRDTIVLLKPVPGYSWQLVSTIPLRQLLRENNTILLVTIASFLTGLLLSFSIWHFVFSRIYRPINELKHAVAAVQEGDLEARAPVVSNDEIGDLSLHFNTMVLQIGELFERVVNEQGRAKDAQYRALQAQINPHFLYNTLNSIRWLAIIQKADNIKEVIDALVRLLVNSSKRSSAPIPLREEIDSVRDYVFIQKLAYAGRFDVQWEIEEALSDWPCIPFILQPIVENALFHGIEPKAKAGLIRIRVAAETYQGGPCIALRIRDDGVGMSRAQIEAVLAVNQTRHGAMTSIGVANVNERLRYSYGDAFGLIIDSLPGEYTEVLMRIPYEGEKEEGADENRHDCG